MEIAVIRAGMQTTLQDLGRRGHLAEGVPAGGAADSFAHSIANLLVGNAESAPALEATMTGPELEFSEDSWVAVCGARFEGVPSWRPFHVGRGERLVFGRRLLGCRATIAVSGGFDVPQVLGGRGTYLPAAFGGHHGRPLRDGDALRVLPSALSLTGHWSLDERVLPAYSREPTVRVMPGAQAGEFEGELYESRFGVTVRSNRMGIRLEGPALGRLSGGDLISSAVAPGTVQVPPDGHPIVLLADAQTLGGYPRIGHVASVDLPLLAQLSPGDGIRFVRTTVTQAHALRRKWDHDLGLLRQGLLAKVAHT
ncbi:MAG TPA: biotin-dependent carboxyltransferase family protein [Opitutaceae bacterium]|jgi:antagonist of KipI